MALLRLCSLVVATVALLGHVAGSSDSFHRARQRRTAAAELYNNAPRAAPAAQNHSDFRFLTNDTKPYVVESLPEVSFDLGEMYSGLIPIDYSNTSNAIFFIFQPTTGPPVDEVTIFLNGGPGWSSFEGFFQENGRFLWQPGTFRPVENPYTWVNMTNMMWVDQPIGTGYSIGTPVATTQEETAIDFVRFFKNFEVLFGIKNFKIYVTGESYAGRYIPYISSAMLDQNDTEYFNLSGAMLLDPCIGTWDYVQQEIPVYPFVEANNNVLGFNASFLADIAALHESCGYASWLDEYLVFPPSGPQPAVHYNFNDPLNVSCDVFDMLDHAAFAINPCFDVYAVNEECPLLWDVLSHRTQFDYEPVGASVYPNRTDVKKALHVPVNIDWVLDNPKPVFVGGKSGPESQGDTSLDPIQYVLPRIIEATNRVLISNGDLDMIIITNGTLLAIQNMTWNGELGFQSRPSTPMIVDLPDLQYKAVFQASGQKGRDDPQGLVGVQHYERGLMWAQTYLGGHTQPENQPRASYRHLEWMLGKIDVL